VSVLLAREKAALNQITTKGVAAHSNALSVLIGLNNFPIFHLIVRLSARNPPQRLILPSKTTETNKCANFKTLFKNYPSKQCEFKKIFASS